MNSERANAEDRRNIAVAVRLKDAPAKTAFPAEEKWRRVEAIRFDADWQGKNADPGRATEVRLLWSLRMLYVRFMAKYRALTVFSDSKGNGRRDQLWDRDVCEVFLQPDGSEARRYLEFEVSPNGMWIDLAIGPGEKRDLRSGLRRQVRMNEATREWSADLAIPMESLTAGFDPTQEWRVNFFRVEGAEEPRFYSAWRPTKTPQPNFHVPEAFGRLVFR